MPCGPAVPCHMTVLRTHIVLAVLLVISGAAMAAPASSNQLLAPWTGPCGGVPPFDRVAPADFEPAFEVAMTEQLRAIEAITADTAPPTFATTLAALERSGRTLDRVAAVYGVFTSTRNDDEMQAVERRLEPKLAAHRDRILPLDRPAQPQHHRPRARERRLRARQQ